MCGCAINSVARGLGSSVASGLVSSAARGLARLGMCAVAL